MEFKDQLNAVSPSFCLAKWLQVTLHLESGTTHSCHHPDAHKIPLRELRQGAAALHNTLYKKEQRRQMLAGRRPKECGYCWSVEDSSPQSMSDRILKSGEDWAKPHLNDVLATPVNENILPTYLELSFSHTCNFKCSYCSAGISSSWESELKQFGSYSTRTGEARHKPLLEDENPYITAFWQWWPELRTGLHTLRITGGEPLLSPNTFRLLDELNQQPCPQLAVALNTNLGMSANIVQKFVSRVQNLVRDGSVKSFTVYTSLEAWGERAEYIRHGLDFPLFLQNLNFVLHELPQCQVVVMSTFNALCAGQYKVFLTELLALRAQWTTEQRPYPLVLDISHLRDPAFQAARTLGLAAVAPTEEALQFMGAQTWPAVRGGFRNHEVHKLARILEWLKTPLSEEQQRVFRFQFFQFFTEHDRRRQTNLSQTFPELNEFWSQCEHT